MVWFISGSRVGLALGVSESGALHCHGSCQHDPRPIGLNDFGSNIDHSLLGRIRRADCSWGMYMPEDSDASIDPAGEGLLQRVRKSPDGPHGMIKFFEDPDAVGFHIVLPQARYLRVQRLLELVLQSDSLEYLLTVDFLGFRVPAAETDTPTWQEFIGSRPYFFSGLSLTVRHPSGDA
jgi:hypothetical protein